MRTLRVSWDPPGEHHQRNVHAVVHNPCMIDRRLQVLRMVAACGTVTGAAEALHYAPSAVSQQLRTLSKDLGVELIVHEGRRIRLTPAARTLLAHADDLYARWEEARAEVLATSGEEGGDLRMCGFSTAAAALLPPVAARIQARVPGCRVTVIEADPGNCFELLLADLADVAVVVATAQVPSSADPRFEQKHLIEDTLDLLVPESHRLAGEAAVSLADLAGEPWIMDRPGRPYHQLLQTACASAGFTPIVAHQASEWDTGAALVAAALGIALIPRLAHVPEGYPVTRVPLIGEPAPSRHILTGVRRGSAQHPMIAMALSELRETAEASRAGPR